MSIAYAVIRQRLSLERFAPYEAATGGDLTRAFALYEWNMEMSADAFHTIGIFEVVLRNALVSALTGRFGPSWYKVAPLDSNGQRDVQRAIWRATKGGRTTESPGRVVAELSFGFWRFLLTRRYQGSPWRPVASAVGVGNDLGLDVLRRLIRLGDRGS